MGILLKKLQGMFNDTFGDRGEGEKYNVLIQGVPVWVPHIVSKGRQFIWEGTRGSGRGQGEKGSLVGERCQTVPAAGTWGFTASGLS